MTLSLNIEVKKLNLTFLLSSNFKVGHQQQVYDYENYQMKTVTGALGLGFLSIYYARTIHY